MGRPLQVDWQDSENDLRSRYLEETDHQDRTRLSEAEEQALIQEAREGKLRTIWDGVEWTQSEAGVEYS